MYCMRLAGNAGRKISPKNRRLGTITQLCWAISSQVRHISTIGKNLLNSNISPRVLTIWCTFLATSAHHCLWCASSRKYNHHIWRGKLPPTCGLYTVTLHLCTATTNNEGDAAWQLLMTWLSQIRGNIASPQCAPVSEPVPRVVTDDPKMAVVRHLEI